MTIQIIDVIRPVDELGEPTNKRAAIISIDSKDGLIVYRLNVGNLSDKDDLQIELNAREPELRAEAVKRGELFDVYELPQEISLPSLTRVMLNELNILRRQLVLPEKTEEEIKDGMKDDLTNNVDLTGRKVI